MSRSYRHTPVVSSAPHGNAWWKHKVHKHLRVVCRGHIAHENYEDAAVDAYSGQNEIWTSAGEYKYRISKTHEHFLPYCDFHNEVTYIGHARWSHKMKYNSCEEETLAWYNKMMRK
mgnify:CR=1 FL=1|jgi:hypothetical protein